MWRSEHEIRWTCRCWCGDSYLHSVQSSSCSADLKPLCVQLSLIPQLLKQPRWTGPDRSGLDQRPVTSRVFNGGSAAGSGSYWGIDGVQSPNVFSGMRVIFWIFSQSRCSAIISALCHVCVCVSLQCNPPTIEEQSNPHPTVVEGFNLLTVTLLLSINLNLNGCFETVILVLLQIY